MRASFAASSSFRISRPSRATIRRFLALTPATNTVAIRRLDLQVGSGESGIAAWVKFPDLTVQPLPQRYTRLAKTSYRYESNTGFSAEITVDDLGLVTTYPGGWERIGSV
jgi:uncharacterized protein